MYIPLHAWVAVRPECKLHKLLKDEICRVSVIEFNDSNRPDDWIHEIIDVSPKKERKFQVTHKEVFRDAEFMSKWMKKHSECWYGRYLGDISGIC